MDDLSREVSQTVSIAVVTTNCEKSAEAIVDESRRAEQRNRVIKCMLLVTWKQNQNEAKALDEYIGDKIDQLEAVNDQLKRKSE